MLEVVCVVITSFNIYKANLIELVDSFQERSPRG